MAQQAIVTHDGRTVPNIGVDPLDYQLLAVLLLQPINDGRYFSSRRSAIGVYKNQCWLTCHRQGRGRPAAAACQQQYYDEAEPA